MNFFNFKIILKDRLAAGFLFFAAVVLGLGLSLKLKKYFYGLNTNAAKASINAESTLLQICDFVANKIYLDEKIISPWKVKCQKRAQTLKQKNLFDSEQIAAEARSLFEELDVSHLDLYDTAQVREIWTGEYLQNGLDLEFIDGDWIITGVWEKSPAQKLGLKYGDLVVSFNEGPGIPLLVNSQEGLLKIKRNNRILEVHLKPIRLYKNENIQVVEFKKATHLKIPSFRADFFSETRLKEISNELKKREDLVVVDLRGNSGGNFVSGLRLLSLFLCGSQTIGNLYKPKKDLKQQESLPNDLSDEVQISLLEKNELVELKTFDSYACVARPTVVLIDSETASTAEMVAQGLRDTVGAKIIGENSAGRLLVGIWYTFPELGEGWRISIPEAIYMSSKGEKIEGKGLTPVILIKKTKTLFRSGRDLTLEKAVSL